MASAIVSPTLVPRDASVTQKTRAETRLSGRNGAAGAACQVGVVCSLRSSRKELCGRGVRATVRGCKPLCTVRADFVNKDTPRSGVGETVSLRDVASESQGGVGDSSALRDISSEAAAEGGATPELHKTARDKAEHSPLHESVKDIEEKADEVSSAVAEQFADGSEGSATGKSQAGDEKTTSSDNPSVFQDVVLPQTDADTSGKTAASNGRSSDHSADSQDVPLKLESRDSTSALLAKGDAGRGIESGSLSAQAGDDTAELPTAQEIGAEIVETIKDGIEQLKWSAESAISSGGYARTGFETAKGAIDRRLKGLSIAAEEVREVGAQAAGIAQKGWSELQKEVSSLTEELQGSSDDLAKQTADGSQKSRSQILQALNQVEERARAVGDQVTETARQISDQARERGTKLGQSAEKVLHDIQEQSRQVGEAVSDAAQEVQSRGARVSESSGRIIKEAENLSRDLAKGGESEPNSNENYGEKLQNQGAKVSASTGNVIRESEGLWRDLLHADKQKETSNAEGGVSGTDLLDAAKHKETNAEGGVSGTD